MCKCVFFGFFWVLFYICIVNFGLFVEVVVVVTFFNMDVAQNLLVVAILILLVGVRNEKKYQTVFPFFDSNNL